MKNKARKIGLFILWLVFEMPGGREKIQCDEFVVVESVHTFLKIYSETLNITQLCALPKVREAAPSPPHRKDRDC